MNSELVLVLILIMVILLSNGFYYVMVIKSKYNNWLQINGLDYPGSLRFIFKRWLIRHKLGFLVPFYYTQDNYSNSIQFLYVYRFGKLRIEKWRWPNYRDSDILDRVKKKGIINQKTLYKIIQAEATLIDDNSYSYNQSSK